MKTTIWMAAFALITTAAFAQPEDLEARMEKLENMRIAKITTELNLTSAEAEKFWPVYNEMRSKIKALVKERQKAMRQLEQGSDLTPADKEALILANFERDKALATIKQQYHQKFKELIGLEKTLKLHETEREMQVQMVKRMRKGKGGGRRPGPTE